MQIEYLSKIGMDELEKGAFGYYSPQNDCIFIRSDLPKPVIQFLIKHEQYHATDKIYDGWAKREWRANKYAVLKEPIGAVLTLFLSLCLPYRWAYYYRRGKN